MLVTLGAQHEVGWKKNSPGPDWVNCLAGLLQTPWHALEHEANNENNFTNDGVTRNMCFMGVCLLGCLLVVDLAIMQF